MQVSVETFGALGRRLTVAVPADRVEKEFTARLQRLSKQVKMPGFRPGKVPLKMVEAQYGVRLMDEVAGELIQTSMFEAIGSQGLRPAGDPQVQRKPVVRGEQLEYTVEFEIFPEVKHFDLAGKRIERPVVTVADEDVDRTLETIRKQRVTWNPVERDARLGDRVTIDFVGRLDGKEIEGGKANGFHVVLGSGSLIEDMEKGIIGAKNGDTRHVPATFPLDYRHSPLAGKRVDFEVKILGVDEANLPELNEAFATEMGVKEGGLDKLKADVRSNLEREAANRARAIVRARALKFLLDANPIEVPQNLVEAEIRRLKNTDASTGVKAGDEMNYQRRSRNRVALGLILGEFIRSRGLVTDPAKVRARLEEMAADYESPQEFIQWHYQKPERLAEIESLIMEEQVVEELLKSAEITDQPVNFQDLLKIESTVQ
ncbi:MAG: trigger factor [Gammaproteobacteria bacterium]|nr:trigger factor [Gammaproteobacteria bacterium]MDH3369767.1 trigger factor [Gammaproteobacteria bacterium]MDH3406671.1 trigger factor [Gammaproteobacteria bacterium]MDH5486007.1 trigger factor [Gammaproteobacteria bacterium]